jgi:hypothetical protein
MKDQAEQARSVWEAKVPSQAVAPGNVKNHLVLQGSITNLTASSYAASNLKEIKHHKLFLEVIVFISSSLSPCLSPSSHMLHAQDSAFVPNVAKF